MEADHARAIAQRIARGHAYVKHVARGEDFPEVKSPEEFSELIAEVLTDPFSAIKELRSGRQAFGMSATGLL